MDFFNVTQEHGFAVRFANAYARKYATTGRKLVIVPCARNNTGLVPFPRLRNITWEPRGQLFLSCLRRVHSLRGPNSRLVAFLWSQGEADASCMLYGSRVCSSSLVTKGYLPHLIRLVRAFRTQVLLPGAASVPFLLNTLSTPSHPLSCAANPSATGRCFNGIIAAQKKLPLYSSAVYVVDTNGPWFPCDYPTAPKGGNCTLIPPQFGHCCYEIHFGPKQMAYIADRMFELYEKAIAGNEYNKKTLHFSPRHGDGLMSINKQQRWYDN
eukprot:CAMPEP_0184649026 /NCGR_PEP_ID=MMETSP0308-20130426/6303_1 /TAXON_ID=38269 /ORGANISM="Gloeochaete witrockiana, Strain SAG 46.84" /LENGTH=267 /DNA_ID=CAMNT_0027081419 /DNA_START=459 /DNA_END=1262 /DNA_ORIENTATION=+